MSALGECPILYADAHHGYGQERMDVYCVYMVRCRDGSLYTGFTADLEERIRQHNESPRGAKYTRSRRPVELAYAEVQATKVAAMARERAIKRLSKEEKERLVALALQKRVDEVDGR
ncbi:GIY-YIG nuclease family protein [Alicyclobacillus sp. SP_1]|uniref:GIY-YIG nuclease family protein n=1 Tax=Alicyclobacillus sp. SP_1 TaxID=2942475 RepID=UPI002803AE36|nr:GIY-YIG nuclease family protein [Alicyclobacillus sp. SP_1]